MGAVVRNANWDPTTDPGRHHYANRFVFDFRTSIDTRLTKSLVADRGTARTTLLMSNLSRRNYGLFKARAADRLATGPTPCTDLWYPDNRKITAVNVRRALGLAYPYKAVWRAGGSTDGFTRIPAWGPTPPGTLGRTLYQPLPGHVPGATDPTRAKALLKRADALNYTITFPYETDVPTSRAVKDQIVIALKRAGFNPQPYATTSRSYAALITNPSAPINVRSGTWCSDWPTSSLWVTQLFASPHVQPLGSRNGNLEHFSTSAVDSRILANLLLPIHQQPAASAALEAHIMRTSLPVIPTGYVVAALAHGGGVQGASIDTVRGEPTFENLWVRAG